MDDKSIVDLYWARSENAIHETSIKYGKYCYAIAFNILNDSEDAAEMLNDITCDMQSYTLVLLRGEEQNILEYLNCILYDE